MRDIDKYHSALLLLLKRYPQYFTFSLSEIRMTYDSSESALFLLNAVNKFYKLVITEDV